MPWIRADFKDQVVWAEVDSAGKPVVTGGRRAIRYQDKAGARIYRAAALGVLDQPGAPVELPAGEEPDSAPSQGPSRAGSSRAGPTRAGRGSGFGSAGDRTEAQARAAAADARSRLAQLSPDTVRVFTDGACQGNPGPAGSGVVMKLPDGRTFERHRALGQGTNNIGELTAIAMALELLTEHNVNPQAPIALFSDSEYARGVLTLGWKAKANVELINSIRARWRTWPNLKLEWVAGHVGIPENERADALARKGVEESRRSR